jgi:signal transduction histidine kinase
VRIAFAVLALAGGAGIFGYLILAATMAPPEAGSPEPVRSDRRTIAGVACLTTAALLGSRSQGLWFGDALVWPAALAGLGAAVLWTRSEAPWSRVTKVSGPMDAVFARVSPVRLAAGGLLILAGMGTFLASNIDLGRAAGTVVLPVIVTAAGVALVFGPWLWRLANDLSAERSERIRQEERSSLAAHLHDSVLQTFALIQRADSPARMATLARVQERELRSWLYGKSDDRSSELLSTALDAMAARLEELHEFRVEVVVVGDAQMDDALEALVGAVSEAVNNAGRHSGAPLVSVYVEVEPDAVMAYVRDQGNGFDPSGVPDDRRGISDSIVNRVARHGGSAGISSHPGEGTEVVISIPHNGPKADR